MDANSLFTIGHSNLTIEDFITLLHKYAITAVADVRSQPYSRYLPHFNRPALQATLRAAEIHYVFLGRELGARPENPDCYVDGQAQYERIAATPLFAEGLERLRKGLLTSRIAIMCAEKDPLVCHRTILVCRYLRQSGITIDHILADGGLESHWHLEQRLLREHGLHQASFFDRRSPEELLEEAYSRQGKRIAFIRSGQNDECLETS